MDKKISLEELEKICNCNICPPGSYKSIEECGCSTCGYVPDPDSCKVDCKYNPYSCKIESGDSISDNFCGCCK